MFLSSKGNDNKLKVPNFAKVGTRTEKHEQWHKPRTQDIRYVNIKTSWLIEIKCMHVQLMHVYRSRVFS